MYLLLNCYFNELVPLLLFVLYFLRIRIFPLFDPVSDMFIDDFKLIDWVESCYNLDRASSLLVYFKLFLASQGSPTTSPY
jgi:hypothetical protein